MPKIASLALTLCAIFIASFPQTAAAKNDDGYITYSIKSGDTLIRIAKNYFQNPASYRLVQRSNGIADPMRIPIGKTIRIARSLLKHTPSNARIAAVRGNVQLSGIRAAKGSTVSEGAVVSTGTSSYVSLQLEDNSTIAIPSNSTVKIAKLRKYLLGGSLDYEFAVSSGGASSKVKPHKSQDDRYRIRSPKAVSAVRGTEFQVRYDGASGSDFAEVVEGALAVDTGAVAATELPVGQGLAVTANGALTQEALLTPPTLIEPGKTQSKKMMQFTVTPTGSEAGYRMTWASDAGFIDTIADITTSNPAIALDGFENGNYFLRARSISPAGIQGMPATFAFRRRLNDVQGTAAKGNDGFNFKWSAAGSGVQRFHFQLFQGSKDNIAIIDEAGLTEQKVTISDLPAGDYFWRVGSVLYLDGEVATDWTDFEKLTLSE